MANLQIAHKFKIKLDHLHKNGQNTYISNLTILLQENYRLWKRDWYNIVDINNGTINNRSLNITSSHMTCIKKKTPTLFYDICYNVNLFLNCFELTMPKDIKNKGRL